MEYLVAQLSTEKELELDPVIRELVVYLRQCGWDTCDSGDGYSKFKTEDGQLMPVKHVMCEDGGVDQFSFADARSLADTCNEFTGSDKWYVELSYSTKDDKTFLIAMESSQK
jgi:hypothetical protein